jgi:signal transduction histidine kinase
MRLPKAFSNLNLTYKINTLLLLVLGIALASLVAVILFSLQQLTLETGRQRAETEMRIFTRQFALQEDTLGDAARLLARTTGLIEAVAQNNIAEEQSLLLPTLTRLDVASVEVLRTDGSRATLFGNSTNNFTEEENTELLALARAGIETTTILHRGEERMLTAISPLKDLSGTILGTILVSRSINGELLSELVLEVEDVNVALINPNGEYVEIAVAEEGAEEEFDFTPDPAIVNRASAGEVIIPEEFAENEATTDFIVYGPLTAARQSVTNDVVVIKIEAQDLLAVQQSFLNAALVGLTIATLLAVVAMALALRQLITVPLTQLSQASQTIAGGKYTERVTATGRDEIGQLGQQFNRMAEAVQTQITATEVAREQAERSDKVKSAFLASMSHELRTPLNSIINFTKFVGAGDLGPVNQQQEEMLDEVVKSGRHLLNLINDVLDMSKIEAGALNLFVEENVNLRAVLEQSLTISRSLLTDKPVELRVNLDRDLPTIRADRQRLIQVFLNVLSNACKFTERGFIQVDAHQNQQMIEIAVRDTGPGIPLEDQTFVFEPFRQTNRGLRQGGGTGLGMPITKNLVEAHGGKFWLESEVGKGTTFHILLPVRSETLTPVRLTPEYA